MRLLRDDQAASPLVVLATFVLAAILVTVLVYALVFDRPEPRLQVVQGSEAGAAYLEVTHAGGALSWDDVTLRFVDRAGTDQAATFLQTPTGGVDKGDRVAISPNPPGGTYLLLVLKGGDELSRLSITF